MDTEPKESVKVMNSPWSHLWQLQIHYTTPSIIKLNYVLTFFILPRAWNVRKKQWFIFGINTVKLWELYTIKYRNTPTYIRIPARNRYGINNTSQQNTTMNKGEFCALFVPEIFSRNTSCKCRSSAQDAVLLCHCWSYFQVTRIFLRGHFNLSSNLSGRAAYYVPVIVVRSHIFEQSTSVQLFWLIGLRFMPAKKVSSMVTNFR